jgi:cell cycle arrest protein BUB2
MPLQLLDICLFTLDPELYFYLRSKSLEAKVYAMARECYFDLKMNLAKDLPKISTENRFISILPAILTFCACIQPLDEVLVLWDFLLAYGVHLNILAVAAQLQFARDDILRSDRLVSIGSLTCSF